MREDAKLKAGFTAVALLFVAVRANAQDAAGQWFLWEEANAQVAAAATRDDFLRAAQTYGQLLDSGVRNGPLFYNLGTSLLKAGRYGAALDSLVRAERYMGSRADIRRNLLLALAGRRGADDGGLPWYRPLLFWHFGLATSTRATIAIVAFTLAWVSLVMRDLGWRRAARPMLAVSLVCLALFGSSVAASWHRESGAEAALATGGPLEGAVQPSEEETSLPPSPDQGDTP